MAVVEPSKNCSEADAEAESSDKLSPDPENRSSPTNQIDCKSSTSACTVNEEENQQHFSNNGNADLLLGGDENGLVASNNNSVGKNVQISPNNGKKRRSDHNRYMNWSFKLLRSRRKKPRSASIIDASLSSTKSNGARIMAFGACASFVLIVGAYLLGRFFSDAAICPNNRLMISSFKDNFYDQNSTNNSNKKTNSTNEHWKHFDYTILLRDPFFRSNRKQSVPSSASSDRKSGIVRLERRVEPTHYDIHLDLTDLHSRRLRGDVKIHFETTDSQNIDWFVLHVSQQHLIIKNLSVVRADQRNRTKLTSLNWNFTSSPSDYDDDVENNNNNDVSDLLNITVPLKSSARYELSISYVASICDDKSGVNCFNEDIHNSARPETVFVSTKLEPTAARTIIPSFDEPQYKTTFNVSFTRRADTVVITNGQLIKRTRNRRGQVVEYFESTPPMSVYLFGFVVGRYVKQESRTERGVKVAVWTRREDRSRGQYARDYATRLLAIIENYFAINYPMPKLDLVAVPDYPVGAMENWGLLIFHRNTLLFASDADSSLSSSIRSVTTHLPSKFHVSKIIAHELIHQWFGNLATMNWWSELWLNEGFATFFISEFLRPDFPVLVDFHESWNLIETWSRQTSFLSQNFMDNENIPNRDINFLSLVRNFTSEQEIYEAFDEHHLYAKGAAVVRILWSLLGDQSMRAGLVRYLTSNAYKSVDRWTLWKFLEYDGSSAGTRAGLGELMESWLLNPGFPEVHVVRTSAGTQRASRLQQQHEFRVEQHSADQRRHCAYISLDSLQSVDDDPLWSVPLPYMIAEHPLRESRAYTLNGQSFWLTNRSRTYYDSTLTSSQWLLINPDMQFPYRVNYDNENWSKLIGQLRRRHDMIQTKSRLQLIVDSSFFLKDSDDGVILFLDLLGYLRKETELLPLIAGLREIYTLLDQYKASSVYRLLVFYFRPVIDQMTKIRSRTEQEAELDAVWWLDDSFQFQLKLLQCVTRNRRCAINREEAHSLLSFPNVRSSVDHYVYVCEFLRRNFTGAERKILTHWLERWEESDILDNINSFQRDVIYMIGCVREMGLIRRFVNAALSKGDFELLAAVLSSTFTLNYNDQLVTEIWAGLATNFSTIHLENGIGARTNFTSEKYGHIRNMLRSIRTLAELELARRAVILSKLISSDNDRTRTGLDELLLVEAKLRWQESRTSALEDWLMEKLVLNV